MSDMSEIIKTTLEGINDFTDVNSVVGSVIQAPNGMSIIPISKISVGFLGGGADYGQKKLTQSQSFGGGSGAGISISPIAFLTIAPDSTVNVINLTNETKSITDRISGIIDRTPEIIQKIKQTLS
jgi:sporulation protein YtfJ